MTAQASINATKKQIDFKKALLEMTQYEIKRLEADLAYLEQQRQHYYERYPEAQDEPLFNPQGTITEPFYPPTMAEH